MPTKEDFNGIGTSLIKIRKELNSLSFDLVKSMLQRLRNRIVNLIENVEEDLRVILLDINDVKGPSDEEFDEVQDAIASIKSLLESSRQAAQSSKLQSRTVVKNLANKLIPRLDRLIALSRKLKKFARRMD